MTNFWKSTILKTVKSLSEAIEQLEDPIPFNRYRQFVQVSWRYQYIWAIEMVIMMIIITIAFSVLLIRITSRFNRFE